MKIEKDKVVSVSYVLSADDEVLETVTAKKPMTFIAGTGYLLPKFEEYITGKRAGDAFEFTLDAVDAYGEVMPDAIVELPKNIFEVEGVLEEGLLTPGSVLPMSDAQGNRLNGVIEEVLDTTVIMNFNHPLAGETLHFKGTIVAVRDASPDERLNGLYGERTSSCGGGHCHSDDCSNCF
jgi:FKBP-type peptidyl-prolyl cis-trans isomerase SlyD